MALKIDHHSVRDILNDFIEAERTGDWVPYSVRPDGIYAHPLTESAKKLLELEEIVALRPPHPTGIYDEPVLRLPCSLDELRGFVESVSPGDWERGRFDDLMPQTCPPLTAPRSAEDAATPLARADAKIAALGTVCHTTRGKRRHTLETPIEGVRDGLPDPNDASAIIAALEASSPQPFLGKRGPNGGLAYTRTDTGEQAEFTVKNCRDYLRYRRRNAR